VRTRKEQHRWSDLSGPQRAAAVAAGTVQIGLAVTAWVDLARRPTGQVNGSKRVWAAVIAINYAGPLAYFRWGRRR
jgi:hypothetical protein